LLINLLQAAKACGNQNILALRGDPPRGQEQWASCDNGFAYASDLVAYIRQQYGDYFSIGVAGYPEGHLDSTDREEDFKWLKFKVDQGADFIVTQLFYDTGLFLDWVKECRTRGITVPIIPGIMPIQSFGGFNRMTSLCKTFVPDHIKNALEPIKVNSRVFLSRLMILFAPSPLIVFGVRLRERQKQRQFTLETNRAPSGL
jgi:methylenetetrahydrofolate reductase (NADPH)